MTKLLYKSDKIKNLLVFEPEIFTDFRGENCETFNKEIYHKLMSEYVPSNIDFVTDSFSFSTKNVLRGFHGDKKTWKLIQCLKGNVYFVVIDMRLDSQTYMKHDSFSLNEKTRLQILIPNGCVNAHLCMSDECIFNYKLSENYVDQQNQLSIKWNDPKYNIWWPITTPILSKRDS